MTDLNDCTEEVFEERAAVLEYMGGWPREKAEALARAEADSWRKARETAARDARVQR